MNHQDIAKLILLVLSFGSLTILWLSCRPLWTIRFRGKAESVQFRAYTSFGARRSADAYRRKHRLGHYKMKKGY